MDLLEKIDKTLAHFRTQRNRSRATHQDSHLFTASESFHRGRARAYSDALERLHDIKQQLLSETS